MWLGDTYRILYPNRLRYKEITCRNSKFIFPCIASTSLKYNQQDATFSRSAYFSKLLYMFQAVPPPIIRRTKLYTQRPVLSNQYCCLLLSWMRWNSVPPPIIRSIKLYIQRRVLSNQHCCLQTAILVWQYLTLYVQYCSPDDGRRNRLKHVE